MTTVVLSAILALGQAQTPQTQTPPSVPAVTQAPQEGPVLTLDEAVAIARKNAFDIATAASNIRQTRARLNEARATLGPKLSANAQDTHNFTATQNGKANTDNRTAGVTFTMPVDLTGIIGRGIKGAESTVHAQEQNAQATENNVVLDTRTAYYNVLRANALVSVAQQAVTSAQQAVTTEQQQFQAGIVAQVDVLRLQAQLSQAQSDLIAAQTGLAVAKENLNNVMGRPIETPFQVQDVSTLPPLTLDADTLAKAAVMRRPEIRAIQYQREALHWITLAQQGGLEPSLNLSAGYNHNFNAPSGFNENASSATISLSWPIFDSGLTRARVQEARESEVQAAIAQAQLELGVSFEVRQAVTNLVNARATLDVAQSQVTAAAETYRLAQVRLQAGEGTSLEVSTSLTALVQAQQGLANARYNYLTAYAQLQQAVASDDPNAVTTEQGTGKK